jgi:hypothetical protein
MAIPFGANLNGQTVCYKTESDYQTSESSDFDSCGTQLSQVSAARVTIVGLVSPLGQFFKLKKINNLF